MKPAWTPLQRCVMGHRATGAALDAVRDFLAKDGAPEIWGNSRYTVCVRRTPMVHEQTQEKVGDCVHLSIHDHERSATHDWRDLQRIKNEICGPEEEAIELYPAESRLVDSSNEWHLFCVV